jgi:Ca2+-binding RTX toxin-like protein
MNGHGGGPLLTLMSGAQATVTGAYSGLRISNGGGNVSVDMTQSGGALNGAHFSFSIQGGASTTSVYAGMIGIATASGPQGATIRLGDGAAQVTSNGHDTIWAGAGADTIILAGGGAAEVHAGTGSLAVYGRGIPVGSEGKVYANGGTTTLDGDTGNIIYYGGNTANTVNAKLGRVTLIGGAGRMTVSGGYSQTITGGSGGLNYSAGAAASGAITTAFGASNMLNLGTSSSFTINSWGSDIITGGSGGTFVVHGSAIISGGTGNRTMTLMGTDLVNGGGQDNVTVTAGANVVFNTGVSATINETGAMLMVSVGGAQAGSATIAGGAATAYTSTTNGLSITTKAAAGTQITLDAGTAKVTTNGADQIHAGSGSAAITLLSDNVQIWGGSGNISVSPLYLGHTGLHFVAGTGTANLNLWSAGGNDIVFGKGNTTVSAGGGPANTFEFFAGQGGAADVISGFRVGTDHLTLHGVTIASQSVSGGSANLVLSDNTHVQLVGVTNLTRLLS